MGEARRSGARGTGRVGVGVAAGGTALAAGTGALGARDKSDHTCISGGRPEPAGPVKCPLGEPEKQQVAPIRGPAICPRAFRSVHGERIEPGRRP